MKTLYFSEISVVTTRCVNLGASAGKKERFGAGEASGPPRKSPLGALNSAVLGRFNGTRGPKIGARELCGRAGEVTSMVADKGDLVFVHGLYHGPWWGEAQIPR